MSFKEASEGYFEKVPDNLKMAIRQFVFPYKVRNQGAKNLDGSYGKIRITPKELNDLIAGAIVASWQYRPQATPEDLKAKASEEFAESLK